MDDVSFFPGLINTQHFIHEYEPLAVNTYWNAPVSPWESFILAILPNDKNGIICIKKTKTFKSGLFHMGLKLTIHLHFP